MNDLNRYDMSNKKPIPKKDEQIKFEEEIKHSVDLLDSKIEEVEKVFNELEGKMKDEYEQKLETMQSKKDTLISYLNLIKELTAEKWEENKEDLSKRYKKASNEIEEAYEGIKASLSYAFESLNS